MTEEKAVKRKYLDFTNFTWPVILIFCGATLLLNNLGIVEWSVWYIIVRFWPLLLIFAGIDYIFGNNIAGSFITFIITLFVILFVFTFSISRVNPNFDQFVGSKYPDWQKLKDIIPERNFRNSPFRCNPWDKNCYRFYNF